MIYKVVVIYFPSITMCDVWRVTEGMESVLLDDPVGNAMWHPSNPAAHYEEYKYQITLETTNPIELMEYLTDHADIDTQQKFWEVL